MKTVNSVDEMRKYLNQGEKEFLAGNKKMSTAFRVYGALGHSDREKLENMDKDEAASYLVSVGLISEPTMIILAGIAAVTILGVIMLLKGRRGTVKMGPRGPELKVD